MGCSPIGKLISMAFGKHDGRGKKRSRKRSNRGGRRAYSPPPPPPHVTPQSMAKSVIYRDDSPIVVAQPVQTGQPLAPDLHQHHRPPDADISPSNHARASAGHEVIEQAGAYCQPQYPEQPPEGMVYRYVSSPVVASATWGERRREYFGGEYRYGYPTPMREGIYSIATDANRLTTIFSDENPNACSIV